MTTSLQKSQLKQSHFQKKIKVEGKVDEGQKIIVGYKTVTLNTIKNIIWCEGMARGKIDKKNGWGQSDRAGFSYLN